MENDTMENDTTNCFEEPKVEFADYLSGNVEYIDEILMKEGITSENVYFLISSIGAELASYVMLQSGRFGAYDSVTHSIKSTVEQMLWIKDALNMNKAVIPRGLPMACDNAEDAFITGIEIADTDLFLDSVSEYECYSNPNERGRQMAESYAIYLCLRSEDWRETFDRISEAAERALRIMEKLETAILREENREHGVVLDNRFIWKMREMCDPDYYGNSDSDQSGTGS